MCAVWNVLQQRAREREPTTHSGRSEEQSAGNAFGTPGCDLCAGIVTDKTRSGPTRPA